MKRSLTYVLDELGRPQPEPDMEKFAAWFENHKSRILMRNRRDHGRVLISTIFLGMDHGHAPEKPPVLWETMIFGGAFHNYQRRYTREDDALDGHAEAVKIVETQLRKEKDEL